MEQAEKPRKAGAEPVFKVETKDDHLVVMAPYNKEFIGLARLYGGRFDRDNQAWAFAPAQEKIVNEICLAAFNADAQRVRDLRQVHQDACDLVEGVLNDFVKDDKCKEQTELLAGSHGDRLKREMHDLATNEIFPHFSDADKYSATWGHTTEKVDEYLRQQIANIRKTAPEEKWSLETRGDRVLVRGPYNKQFVELARVMEGEWNKEEDSWEFNAKRKTLVAQMCAYAYDGVLPKKKARERLAELSHGVGRCARGLPSAGWSFTRMSVILVGFGMNGMRGAYTARGLLPNAPKPRLHPRPGGIKSKDYEPSSPTGELLHQIRAREGMAR